MGLHRNNNGFLMRYILFILLFVSSTAYSQRVICNGWKFRSGGGGGGTPPSTNLWAYYEADNGVTQSSGAVSQWNDLSGAGRHLVQATAGNKPTFSSNTISFDGTSDFLSVAATIAQQSTVYLVVKLNSTSADQALFGDAQNGYGSWGGAVNQFQALDNFGGGVVSSGGTYNNTTTYYLVRFRFNGASSLCQVNNTTAGTGTLGTGTIATPFMIGAISFGGSPAAYGAFTVKAMYIYQGGAGDDTGLKTYTTTKWGLP